MIIAVILIILGTLSFFYFKGKRKIVNEQSSTEKITVTLSKKLQRSLKDLAEGLRDPQTIKAEIVQVLDEVNKNLKTKSAEYLEGLLKSKIMLSKSQKSLMDISANLRNKALSVKDNKDLSRKYMTQSIICRKKAEAITDTITHIEEAIADAEYTYNTQVYKLLTKRVEVESLILNPNVSINTSFLELSELTKEFENKVQIEGIQNEVKVKLNPEYSLEEDILVSDEEIEAEFEKKK